MRIGEPIPALEISTMSHPAYSLDLLGSGKTAEWQLIYILVDHLQAEKAEAPPPRAGCGGRNSGVGVRLPYGVQDSRPRPPLTSTIQPVPSQHAVTLQDLTRL